MLWRCGVGGMRIRTIAIAIALGVVAIGVIALAFQNNLSRFFLNPREPFQVASPPPPPQYGVRAALGRFGRLTRTAPVQMFSIFIRRPMHLTIIGTRPLGMAAADSLLLRVAAPNEAGPFMSVGAVYGPRYRQATLFSKFTHKFDGLASRELAYRDVLEAFKVFRAQRVPGRPFVLVGYEQGRFACIRAFAACHI